MVHFENKHDINKITFQTSVSRAPLHTVYFTIMFIPWNRIPEYDELNKLIKEKTNDPALHIEDITKTVFDIINEYRPKAIKVIAELDHISNYSVILELKEGNI
jgi:hypothetical protein